jgi:hypothetical protein
VTVEVTPIAPGEAAAGTSTQTGQPQLPLPDEAPPVDNFVRRTIAVAIFCIGTAVVAGGIFSGVVGPRFIAAIASLLGCASAYGLRRVKSPWGTTAGVVGSVFVSGIVTAVLVGGFSAFGHLSSDVTKSLAQVHLVRPPIQMTPGFAALVGWLMAGVGFGATWVAVVFDRPIASMLVPIPVAAITAISVQGDAQLASGLTLLATFVIGLGLLSTDRGVSGTSGVSIQYELRRAVRAIPLIGLAIVALVFLSRAGILFPKPIINPTLQAQKPKTQPLSAVKDKVLFDVASDVSGPWAMGALDVYDGKDWRLPPFDQAQLVTIPRSGVVDPKLHPGIKARITVHGLEGAVLPTLPNTVGIVASGPKLTYDARSGNIRLVEGEITNGFTYDIVGSAVPTVNALEKADTTFTNDLGFFTTMPKEPPGVAGLIASAPTKSKWQEWDFLRRYILDNITSNGTGSPVSITPERVDEILSAKEASPYEIVAVQTMLARWVGIPARIGYGFDGGTKVGDHLEVHPRDGAVFPEVYFNQYGWLPVIGIPAKTKVSDQDTKVQQFRKGVLPSQDIAVTIFRPVELPGRSRFFEQARQSFLVVLLIIALIALLYLLSPIPQKALRRARRRREAYEAGTFARIAVAYGEWRDVLTDYGYHHESDTPLMLLKRFPRDDEHSQLAWLVTRALWGDLRYSDDPHMATDAEELSRSLRRRLTDAHTMAVRAVAVLSRASLRTPYFIERAATTEDLDVAV